MCEPCKAAPQAFAPGVIAAHRAPRPRWQRWALAAGRWAWRTLSVACVLIVLLGLAGMAGGHGRSATCPAPATPATSAVPEEVNT